MEERRKNSPVVSVFIGRDSAWIWYYMIIDYNLSAFLQRWYQGLQDANCVFVGPVVQNPAKVINIGSDWLRSEKIMPHVCETTSQLRWSFVLVFSHHVGLVLHDAFERRIALQESNGNSTVITSYVNYSPVINCIPGIVIHRVEGFKPGIAHETFHTIFVSLTSFGILDKHFKSVFLRVVSEVEPLQSQAKYIYR